MPKEIEIDVEKFNTLVAECHAIQQESIKRVINKARQFHMRECTSPSPQCESAFLSLFYLHLSDRVKKTEYPV